MKKIQLIFSVSILFLVLGCTKADQTFVANDNSTTGGSSGTGVGGSYARFTIVGNYLYALSGNYLQTFDISDRTKPTSVQSLNTGTTIETIFPFKDYLLLGTPTGMLMYDITTPQSPKYVSRYDHIRSCDPVVAQDNYAFVTLHTSTGNTTSGVTGRQCDRGVNELHIIDISNPKFPVFKKSVLMSQPLGLGVDGNLLFVCDKGLKVFDITTPINPTQKKHYTNITSFDVIPYNKTLIAVGSDGVHQYDYSNPDNITQLSTLKVE